MNTQTQQEMLNLGPCLRIVFTNINHTYAWVDIGAYASHLSIRGQHIIRYI